MFYNDDGRTTTCLPLHFQPLSQPTIPQGKESKDKESWMPLLDGSPGATELLNHMELFTQGHLSGLGFPTDWLGNLLSGLGLENWNNNYSLFPEGAMH